MTNGPGHPHQGGYDQWGNPLGSAPAAPSGPPCSAPPGPQQGQPYDQGQHQGYSQQVPQQPGQQPLPHPGQQFAQHQPGQMSQAGYGQQPYQQQYGQPGYGYGPRQKSSTGKTWLILGIIAVVLIAVSVILVIVLGGDDEGDGQRGGQGTEEVGSGGDTQSGADVRYVESMDRFIEEHDLTRQSALDEGVMTDAQYDEWYACVIEDGYADLSEGLKTKLSQGIYEMDDAEEFELGALMNSCLISIY